jgi:hypothetical protein
MKKSHLLSIFTVVAVVWMGLAAQLPGSVFAAAPQQDQEPQAVTMTPSQVPTDTPVPPTDTPVPPTDTPAVPTDTPEPTITGAAPTFTLVPDTPIPTYRPSPGGQGNLGLVAFWALAGGFLAMLTIWYGVPLLGKALAKSNIADKVLPFTVGIFEHEPQRKWVLPTVLMLLTALILGYAALYFF